MAPLSPARNTAKAAQAAIPEPLDEGFGAQKTQGRLSVVYEPSDARAPVAPASTNFVSAAPAPKSHGAQPVKSAQQLIVDQVPPLPLEAHQLSLWQSLIMKNHLDPQARHSLFTQASTAFRGSVLDHDMTKTFYQETSPMTWLMVPHALESAQKFLNEGSGPLVRLPVDKQFSAMKTKHQYAVTHSPEKLAGFEALKKTFGSQLAFHGSATSAWHQIITQGLQNKSDSAMGVNGRAYGSGIYLADDTALSAGFCNLLGDKIMAAAEVLSIPSTHHLFHRHGNKFIVAEEKMAVLIRYLFVYEQTQSIPEVHHSELIQQNTAA